MKTSLAGVRGIDHVGITVPDIEAATRWFMEVLGAEELFSLGPFQSEDDWMAENLGVHPRTVLKKLRMLRLATGAKLELFEYSAPDQVRSQPKSSDIGGHHVAIAVEDMDAAVRNLEARGIKLLGKPKTLTTGPAAGTQWCYFLAPWGLHLELVSYPSSPAQER